MIPLANGVEDFGAGCFEVQEDGRLLFHADYTNREELLIWLLTFRDKVELLEPENVREELKGTLRRVLEIYQQRI